MENKYVSQGIIELDYPEYARQLVENDVKRNLLKQIEDILFSGEVYTVQIKKELGSVSTNYAARKVTYSAFLQKVEVKTVTVPVMPQPRPYVQKEGVIRRAARKVYKALRDFIRDNNGGKCESQDCASCPFLPCRKEGVEE